MSDDTTKLLNACVEYRAMVDKLECENAALKQRILDDNKAYGCELRDPSGTIWDHAKRLERENAALREDKERLDYMEKNVDFVSWMYYGKPHSWDFRKKIDAKRKEAQP